MSNQIQIFEKGVNHQGDKNIYRKSRCSFPGYFLVSDRPGFVLDQFSVTDTSVTESQKSSGGRRTVSSLSKWKRCVVVFLNKQTKCALRWISKGMNTTIAQIPEQLLISR